METSTKFDPLDGSAEPCQSEVETSASGKRKRQIQRNEVKKGKYIKVSMQKRNIQACKEVLAAVLIGSTSTKFKRRCVLGLQAILDILLLTEYLELQEAYDIYASFFESYPDKDTFKLKLLDEEIGLCCFTVQIPHTNVTYIVLREKDRKIEDFMELMIENCMQVCKTIIATY